MCFVLVCTLTILPVVITGSYLSVHRREGFISLAIQGLEGKTECTQSEQGHSEMKTGRGQVVTLTKHQVLHIVITTGAGTRTIKTLRKEIAPQLIFLKFRCLTSACEGK